MTKRDTTSKIATNFDYIMTAYHESGHVIYALLHIMRVQSVSIYENKEFNRVDGVTCYDSPNQLECVKDTDYSNLIIRHEVGINYAGLISEKILLQSISGSAKTPLFVSEGSSDDNKNARDLIKKYNISAPGKPRIKYKQTLLQDIRRELYEYWDDVILISHALFNKHKLVIEDLQRLLTKKSLNKIFWKEQFKKINYLYDSCLDTKNLNIIFKV